LVAVLIEAIAFRNACSLSTDAWGQFVGMSSRETLLPVVPRLQRLAQGSFATAGPEILRVEVVRLLNLPSICRSAWDMDSRSTASCFDELAAMLHLL